jgi:hypothetical protein
MKQNTKKIAKRVKPVICFRCQLAGHYANECRDGILLYKSTVTFAKKHGNPMQLIVPDLNKVKEIKLPKFKIPEKENKLHKAELESWMLPDCVYEDDASDYNDGLLENTP